MFEIFTENNDDTDVPVPNPRKNMTSPSRSPQKSLNVADVGSARKTRLAALAKNINNWEDDLSHPVIQLVSILSLIYTVTIVLTGNKKGGWSPTSDSPDSTTVLTGNKKTK